MTKINDAIMIQTFEMISYCKILRISHTQHVTNKEACDSNTVNAKTGSIAYFCNATDRLTYKLLDKDGKNDP